MAATAPDTSQNSGSDERYVRPKQSAIVRLGKRLRAPLNRFLERQSLTTTEPIVPSDTLKGLDILQHNWRAVQAEALALLQQRDNIPAFGKISPDHRRIANGPQWKSFFFEGYGFRSPGNCTQCPKTAALLRQIPGLVVAFYSIMEGDTHVPRHKGLTKAWLNCHLPLVLPHAAGRCEMRVDDSITVRWTEGEWLVFDETYPHEVWNDTGEPRVVLMLQVRRPMRWPGRLIAKVLYETVRRTSFVQDIRRAIGA
ncbi:aspartyl/asparaginyl beta-hydroxylase domain-containing protein [Alterisphingorhabdus coralli]|uniref:Aspartyl/asparaginyl beta-hydroxylase domain-containing protein n=1 Tax=Alterisphingorhabdus coralli TaxID=3071408 RepID=A0AA97F879_9SPHN|nr:aspartyl/asparaginyl beta-hydroxylase domain-containing protein [Parasphingorhabdus sp. SCSIO 66989]WOE76229.1 aspartyl/asparaginyl beta-hydroxylase domain-containing protein [Parasphingorhabdus sp. SCSIO 66989]